MTIQHADFFDEQMITFREEEQARILAARYKMQVAYEKATMPTINLLIKTDLLPWESLESLLFRASALNHLPGTSALERSLALPSDGVMSIKRHIQLSLALGQDLNTLSFAIPTSINNSTIRLYGHDFPLKHVSLSTCKICPACLGEFGYGKGYWALAFFSICEIHMCQLIDSCPACEKPLTKARPTYDSCNCGAQHSKVKPARCDEPLIEISKILSAKFTKQNITFNDNYYPDDFLSLELVDILELLAFLGSLSEDPGSTYLSLSRKVVSLKHINRLTKKASHALLDWPNGFHRLLAASRSFKSYNETPASVYQSISHVANVLPGDGRRKWPRLILSGIASFLKRRESWSQRPQ